jgi:hypothetical protein
MRYLFSLGVLAAALSLASACAGDDQPPTPTRHVQQNIEGWAVHVDERLLKGPDADLGRRALQLLTLRLVDIKLAVPADKLARLQKVSIWLDRTHGKLKAAQYHPSVGWLKAHGYDPRLAKCVHIPDAAAWASPAHQRVQPWSVLHELAHAYHDQILGFDHPAIVAAWKKFKAGGRYEKVLHINGRTARHYGLTNPQEFFAEMTEAYFGTNDFFPFNRAELRREEPDIYALLEQIWHGKPRGPAPRQ